MTQLTDVLAILSQLHRSVKGKTGNHVSFAYAGERLLVTIARPKTNKRAFTQVVDPYDFSRPVADALKDIAEKANAWFSKGENEEVA